MARTPDHSDGERLKVTYCGFFVDVRDVAELARWFPLVELKSEALRLAA